MKQFFKNIKKYRKYAFFSAKAELKSEVADSYLNWIWWILEPFCFMLIYTFVFGFVFKSRSNHFASFVMIGLAAWTFFKNMLSGSVKLVSNNRDLVTKVYIPKYILLLSKSLTYLFKFFISLTIAICLMLYQHVPIDWHVITIIPIIVVLYITSFGIGLILMHFGVTISDLSNITNLVLRMVFYLSGVFYNINDKLDGTLRRLLLRGNPAAFCMNEMRKAVNLADKQRSVEGLVFWAVMGIILMVIGVHLIHKNENSYAKVI